MIAKAVLFLGCLALAQINAEEGARQYVFSDLCPPIHHHWLLPHENDCTKFYYCEYGMKWVTPRDCAPGTEFSYQLQVCVHPIFSNCDLSDSSTNPPSTTTTTTSTTTNRPTNTTTTAAPTTTQSDECPSDFSIHQLLPHANCSKFYYCVFGEKVERDCPPGLHFNPHLQVCDWPWDAGCQGVAPSTSTTATGPTTITTQTTPSDECPSDFSIHQLLPHANCSKFYYCVFGEKVERDCPPGLHFNPYLQVCDWPWDAGCDGSASTTTTTGTGSTTTMASPPGSNKCADDCNVLPWAHETDCDSFWMCGGDEKVLVRCSLGLHFNPDKGSCDFICNAGCLRDV